MRMCLEIPNVKTYMNVCMLAVPVQVLPKMLPGYWHVDGAEIHRNKYETEKVARPFVVPTHFAHPSSQYGSQS